jgi:hypothetical protein
VDHVKLPAPVMCSSAQVHTAGEHTFLPDGGAPLMLRLKFRLPRRAAPLEGALARAGRSAIGIVTLRILRLQGNNISSTLSNDILSKVTCLQMVCVRHDAANAM